MKRITFLMLMSFFCLIIITPSYATSISYDITKVSGNTWEYSYSVTNDSLAVDIEDLSIYFEYGLYENITVFGYPSGWDAYAYDPDVFFGLPEDGSYDAWINTIAGISPGDILGGFTLSFDWLGGANETPGPQYFEIFDVGFNVIDSGDTQLAGNANTPIPEPASIVLLGSGICGLLVYKKRTKTEKIV
jgi:hypothetical protein